MANEIYTPPQGPPAGPTPSSDIFKSMKEDGVYQMIEDFYRLLAKSPIKEMFPKTEKELIAASRKNAAFFIQIMGGPPRFSDQFGSPQMRKRHLAFEITETARTQWLNCFEAVLKDAPSKYGFPPQHMNEFKIWLKNFSAWMVNRKD